MHASARWWLENSSVAVLSAYACLMYLILSDGLSSGTSETCRIGRVRCVDIPDAFMQIIPAGEDPNNQEPCTSSMCASARYRQRCQWRAWSTSTSRMQQSPSSEPGSSTQPGHRPDATNTSCKLYFMNTPELHAVGQGRVCRQGSAGRGQALPGHAQAAQRQQPGDRGAGGRGRDCAQGPGRRTRSACAGAE